MNELLLHTVCHFNVYLGNKVTETWHMVSCINDETVTVVCRKLEAPDNYEQSWTYKGDDAPRRALDKILSATGWGVLLNG